MKLIFKVFKNGTIFAKLKENYFHWDFPTAKQSTNYKNGQNHLGRVKFKCCLPRFCFRKLFEINCFMVTGFRKVEVNTHKHCKIRSNRWISWKGLISGEGIGTGPGDRHPSGLPSWKQKSPLTAGDTFQDPQWCLKPRIVPSPIESMFSPIHTYLW